MDVIIYHNHKKLRISVHVKPSCCHTSMLSFTNMEKQALVGNVLSINKMNSE